MELKTIKQFLEYIKNNKLTEAQESYARSTIVSSYDEVNNEPNRLTR